MLTADNIISTFVIVDDFLKNVMQQQLLLGTGGTRGPKGSMTPSEIVTICLLFQFSGYRNFKAFYRFLETYYRHYFPNLLSYNRFVYLKKRVASLFYLFLMSLMGELQR